MIPRFLACFMVLLGAVNLLTGVLWVLGVPIISVFGRYDGFAQATEIQQSSWLLSIVLGIILIRLGRGLLKQRHTAWLWALFFLSLSLLNSCVAPRNWHILFLSAIYLALLLKYRSYFYRCDNHPMQYHRTVAWISVLFALVYGVVGSYLLRNQFNDIHSWIDALYYTFITYSTVGYGDVVPITAGAKLFTISMVIVGVVSFLTALSVLLGPVIQQNLKGVYKMVSHFNQMDQHLLLCGDNVLTRQLAKNCIEKRKTYFFLEPGVTAAALLEADGFNVVHVNPENTEELQKANLPKAACLVSAYDDDAKNILVMMAAQSILDHHPNPRLKRVARIEQLHNVEKAKRAGATAVVSPLKMSAEWVEQQWAV